MKNGIREVCIESRPHPDFLRTALVERYRLYYFRGQEKGNEGKDSDDDKFPQATPMEPMKKYPELSKIYLAERHMDVIGPVKMV